jgi:hypothetical protein
MRKLIGVLAVAVLLIAACGGDSTDDPAAFDDDVTDVNVNECVNPPVTVPSIGVLGQRVKGVSDLKVCVQASASVGIVPEIQNFDDCGNPCYAVVVNDFDLASDSKIEISYKEEGQPVGPIPVDPPAVNQQVSNGRICVVEVGGPPAPCSSRVTQPKNLSITAARRAATLQWRPSAHTGGGEILGYDIWWSENGQDFVYVTTNASTTYTDTGLSRQTNYWYYVVGVDTDGNRSPASPTMQVTTK